MPKRTDGELLEYMGTDAAKWADQFMLVQTDPTSGELDWGAMVSWFANALEAGRSAGRREVCPHSALVELAPGLEVCHVCAQLFKDGVAAT